MHDVNNVRSLSAIIAEIKEELKDFVQTRIALFKNEAQQKIKILKIAAPLGALGVLLVMTAYLLFVLALVGLVVALFHDNPYRWCFAFAIVGVGMALLGGLAAYFAKREFELKGLMPKKTLEVLKGDQLWIQAEAKTRLRA